MPMLLLFLALLEAGGGSVGSNAVWHLHLYGEFLVFGPGSQPCFAMLGSRMHLPGG